MSNPVSKKLFAIQLTPTGRVIPDDQTPGIRRRTMRAVKLQLVSLLAIAVLLLVGRPTRADITIKLEQKDGDKIADIAKIVVRADSGDGIDKVEFAVDDQLRYSTGSTPYIYSWDTIKDTEGDRKSVV